MPAGKDIVKMLIKHILLGALALFSGIAVSAGTFAFLLVIGVIPRMLCKTSLAKQVIRIENVIILGIIFGVVSSVYMWSFPVYGWIFGHMIVALYGISAGIFVGCIAAALAEILHTFPIMFRRVSLKVGLPWVMAAMAFGKLCGSLFYFITGYGIIDL